MPYEMTPFQVICVLQVLTYLILVIFYLKSHRPYIGVTRTMGNYDTESQQFTLEVLLANTGKTPAHNLEVKTEFILDKSFLGVTHSDGNDMIMPSQVRFTYPSVKMTNEDHLQKQDFKVRLHVSYRRGFGKFLPISLFGKYETIHVVQYNPHAKGLVPIEGSAT